MASNNVLYGSLIPLGLGVAFFTGFGDAWSGNKSNLGVVGTGVGIGMSLTGISYLITKDSKKALTIGCVVAIAKIAYNIYKNPEIFNKDKSVQRPSSPVAVPDVNLPK